jgi:hypothetical protein
LDAEEFVKVEQWFPSAKWIGQIQLTVDLSSSSGLWFMELLFDSELLFCFWVSFAFSYTLLVDNAIFAFVFNYWLHTEDCSALNSLPDIHVEVETCVSIDLKISICWVTNLTYLNVYYLSSSQVYFSPVNAWLSIH